MSKETVIPSRVNSFSSEIDDQTDALSEFQPKKTPAPKVSQADLDEISQVTGFASRQAKTTNQPEPEGHIRRYTTGRNQQLNLKVTADTHKRFYAIADELELPLGQVFEMAVKALEATR